MLSAFKFVLIVAFFVIYLNEDCRRHYQEVDAPGQQLSSARSQSTQSASRFSPQRVKPYSAHVTRQLLYWWFAFPKAKTRKVVLLFGYIRICSAYMDMFFTKCFVPKSNRFIKVCCRQLGVIVKSCDYS